MPVEIGTLIECHCYDMIGPTQDIPESDVLSDCLLILIEIRLPPNSPSVEQTILSHAVKTQVHVATLTREFYTLGIPPAS